IVEDARRTGELAPVDIPRVVGLLQRAYATLSPPWLFDQTPEEARRIAYEMCRLLLLGLLTRGDREVRHEPLRAQRNSKPTRRSR
ncbi:unnamed protein product, partial [marine sediment metagenome]